MSPDETPSEDLSPAERGLEHHLELLRASPPVAGAELVPRVIRGIRWQRAVRDPLVLVGAVATAVAEALGLLLNRPAGGS